MKLRHIGAVALSGWFLITPPPQARRYGSYASTRRYRTIRARRDFGIEALEEFERTANGHTCETIFPPTPFVEPITPDNQSPPRNFTCQDTA
jgi:hypothetical protein